MRNNVTGEQFSADFTAEGQTNVCHVGNVRHHAERRSATSMRDGYQGTTTPYKIEGGKVVTNVSQDPYAVTIYKLGDTYYGARSNEFGYANYEIIPAPQFVLESADRDAQPVLDRAGADRTAEAADRPVPEAGDASNWRR